MKRSEIRNAVFDMLYEDVLIDNAPHRGTANARRESRKRMRAAYARQQKRHRKRTKERGGIANEYDRKSEVQAADE